MDDTLDRLLQELERFGEENDAQISERPRRMLNITRDTGEFLAVLVRASSARRILEIGTSNGYSTLWLAAASRALEGRVVTLERSAWKLELARENFARGGLADVIQAIEGDAGEYLAQAPDASCDLIFLDSQRSEYLAWWPQLKRLLPPGGLLVVDNALSHAEEMAEFTARVRADAAFDCCLVPVGKGEFLATRR